MVSAGNYGLGGMLKGQAVLLLGKATWRRATGGLKAPDPVTSDFLIF
jgi:hypothetical protein